MLDAKQIDAMSPQDARKLIVKLSDALAQGERWTQKELADLMGYSHNTVANWQRENGRPPTIAILFLQSELSRRAIVQGLKAFKLILNEELF